jgi:hypothetical protein
VENKNKLLNPILSRFCEIYFPEFIDTEKNTIVNLHQYQLKSKYQFENLKERRIQKLNSLLAFTTNLPTEHSILVEKVNEMYSCGYSAIDLNAWMQQLEGLDESQKAAIELCFEKVKPEYRCEKLLMLYLLNQLFELVRTDNNIDWMNHVGFI